MSAVFVDTSAIIALLTRTDRAHSAAVAAFEGLRSRRAKLVTTSYVLVESYALIDRRLGREALTAFRTSFAPLLGVIWVDAGLHERGLDRLESNPTGLSLVDAVSFEAMRAHRIVEALAFDRHFADQGLGLR
ncbi:MAG TPA: PIN domain-containing protein [Methylomirabilota bacterium]|nr:PIN domain-containing protein [Methylomirabilota bacterium]